METGRIHRLVKKAQEGDARAFEKLMRTKSKNISYIALSILKNQHDAEDAAQDAIESMISHIRTLQNPEAFETWMYRIVFRACLRIQDRGKKQKATDLEEISSLDIVEARPDFLPHESNEMAETSRILLSKMKDLPDNYRNCLYLFYYEDMTYDQIAEVLGLSVKDVANCLDRGRKKLKAEFVYDEIKEKTHAAFEGPLLASAFALDIKETVAGQDFVEKILRRIAAESIARDAGGFLSSPAGKIALTGVVLVAIGMGGLLLREYFPQDGEHSTETDTPQTNAGTAPSAPEARESRERGMAQEDSGPASENAAPENDGPDAGNPSAPSGESEDSGEERQIIIENEVLYGSVDPSDPDNPNTEKDPGKSSNEVQTAVPFNQEEPGSFWSGFPLGKTGDYVWGITAFCGMAALAAAAVLFASQRAKRR